ncbi:MAG: hypothetical protein ACP5IK_00740 [Candidatus Micrarchaeia archaeon]
MKEVGVENGGRIGYPEFAKAIAASDGRTYDVEGAEKKDLAYIVENTCIYCGRLMAKDEVKILPPSYVVERDPYVRNGVVKRRLMCVQCYNEIKSAAKTKEPYAQRNLRSNIIVKSLVKGFLFNK